MSVEALQSQEREVPAGALDGLAEEQYRLERFNPDLPVYGTINEDGNTHGQACAYLTRVARESAYALEAPLDDATVNEIIYRKGTYPAPAPNAVVSKDIQTAVLAITDIQTREPMAVFIRPVETRDKPLTFWIGPPVDPVLAAMTGLPPGLGLQAVPVADEFGQPMGDEVGQPLTQMATAPAGQPLDEVTAWMVRKAAATGAFPSDWFVVLDDRLVADVYQTVFDLFWQDSNLDDFVRDNLLMSNVYGWQTAYYSWDSTNQKHVVRNISIKQVYLDPEQTDLSLHSYVGFDLAMDVDRAKMEYPQLAPMIDAYARQNSPSRVDSQTQFGVGQDRPFYRRTVTFRIFWFRNQLVPMLPQEAIDAGLVIKQQDETGQEQYFPAQQQQLDDQGQPDAATSFQWPMKLGIRQIATLAQTARIVQDIRCEHWDFPMLLNVCIPIPSQPIGEGLPSKLVSIENAENDLLTSIVAYAKTFPNPGCMMPQSIATALGEGLGRTHVDPSETIVCPDELYAKWGKDSVTWFQPPPLPPAVPQTMDILAQKRNSSGGRPEVLQGTSPTANSSAKLAETLSSNATGQFGFQAQWTAKMVKRLANLMHYTHLWRLGIDDVMKIYNRLPPEIMAMVIDKARKGKWDIQVDVNSGTTGQTNRKLQRALSLFQARSATGEPVMTLQTVREEANLDAEQEAIRWKNEQQQAMPTAQPGEGQPGNEPQQQTNTGEQFQ